MVSSYSLKLIDMDINECPHRYRYRSRCCIQGGMNSCSRRLHCHHSSLTRCFPLFFFFADLALDTPMPLLLTSAFSFGIRVSIMIVISSVDVAAITTDPTSLRSITESFSVYVQQ